MEHDTWSARAKFIDKSVSVREMFSFARPAEILSATVTYCCDFYGTCMGRGQSSAIEPGQQQSS